ncbi:MAG: ABC transporter ATP-binding protein [Ruminococcaceae bacterium]|nr:ABC transporter ATP-binding protein [Oscillospiraceae bacterium]
MNNFKLNLRVFKFLSSLSPAFFPLLFLRQVLSNLPFFFNLWISAEIVNELVSAESERKIWALVCVALLGNFALSAITAVVRHYENKASTNLTDRHFAAFTKKILSLDYDKIESSEIRDLRRKIEENSYINAYGWEYFVVLTERLLGNVLNIAYSMFLFAEMMILIARFGLNLWVILLCTGIISALILSVFVSRNATKKVSEKRKAVGEIMLDANRYDSGIPAYSAGKDLRIYKLRNVLGNITNHMLKSNIKGFKEVSTATLIHERIPKSATVLLLDALTYLLACYCCIMGAFPLGSVIKYVGYIGRLASNIIDLIILFTEYKINSQYLELYARFFDIKNEMYQGSLSVEKRSDRNFEIEFKNVSFTYPEAAHPAVKNISFKFRVGEKLAIVGMNGSGKTTLIKLLCRLYDPTDGEIIMNDFNIRKYDYRQYLDLFSVVFQDYKLLSFSLGQNVGAGESFDSGKAEAALRGVGFGDRLDELEKGLDTMLYKDFDSDGVEISGGEAQKIALARALYKDAPFVILDEPTAALDPLAEAEIYSRFDSIVGGKTAIYISHRLSSCRLCDRILVLDKGEIVQYGSHEELLEDKTGKYFELWNAQAQYYNA